MQPTSTECSAGACSLRHFKPCFALRQTIFNVEMPPLFELGKQLECRFLYRRQVDKNRTSAEFLYSEWQNYSDSQRERCCFLILGDPGRVR